VLVTDADQKIFSLHGPMSDDTDWTNKVVAAQKLGRNVNCSTIPANEKKTAIIERAKARGLTEGDVILS
jgi:hypothetical protein